MLYKEAQILMVDIMNGHKWWQRSSEVRLMVSIHDKGSDNVRLMSGSCHVMTKKTSIWVLMCKEKRMKNSGKSDFRHNQGPAEDDTAVEESLWEKVLAKYQDFLDVFSKKAADTLPEHHPIDHKIDLEPGAQPPLGYISCLLEVEALALWEFLQEHLQKEFIWLSKSPARSAVLFVKKKDRSLQLCVDYQGLNKITKKDQYSLPLIPDLLDHLQSTKQFTKLNLQGAYNLVWIAEGNEWKTAFQTHYGSFEFLVMHFGLCNALATFQCYMNKIFADLLDICVVVYLDDILIYSTDPEKHDDNVWEVFWHLQEHKLFCKVEKCEFDTNMVEFLGFIISPARVHMDKSKVEVIKTWPTLHSMKDVQSFLGFANFYQRFIEGYSGIVLPLTQTTQKNVPWEWSDTCQNAFNTLKSVFTSALILHHWSPDHIPLVETDALDYVIATIFSMSNPAMESCIQSHSIHGPSLDLSWTTISTTKSSWPSMRHSVSGTTTLKDLCTPLTLLPTTRIWSISQPPKSSPRDRPSGLSFSLHSVMKVTFTSFFHPFFLTYQYPYQCFLCHHVTWAWPEPDIVTSFVIDW